MFKKLKRTILKIVTILSVALFVANVEAAVQQANKNSQTNYKSVTEINASLLLIDAQISAQNQAILKQLPSLNVYRMLTNVPQSVEPFVKLVKSLIKEGKLNPRLREIAIMRVAYLTHAPYEWYQHQFLAKNNGVTPQELTTISHENPVTSLNAEENFVCQVADELTKNVTLSDKAYQKLYNQYGNEQGTELITVISFYNMVSRFLNGVRVPIEKTTHPPLENLKTPVEKLN